MLGACRCRHHKPAAESWLFFCAHQWVCKIKGMGSSHFLARRAGHWLFGTERLTQRGIAAFNREAIPGRAGPTVLGQSRLVSEEHFQNSPDHALPGSHQRSWRGISTGWIITSGESEARRVLQRALAAVSKCGLPIPVHSSCQRGRTHLAATKKGWLRIARPSTPLGLPIHCAFSACQPGD